MTPKHIAHVGKTLGALLLAQLPSACDTSTEEGASETSDAGADDGASADGSTAADDGDSGEANTGSDGSSGLDAGESTLDCANATAGADSVACAAVSFLNTLGSSEQGAQYAFSDSVNKTCWSNLPGQDRPGVTFGALDEESRAAAMAVARAVLSDEGYEDLRGVLAADDYLGLQSSGGGPGGGGSYTSDNAHIAVFGTPGQGDWMLSIGNHHMAYNVTFAGSTVYPTPNHLGAEPRGSFTVDSETFGPLISEGDAMARLFGALGASELSSAHVSGTYADILLGPDEYCTGDYSKVQYPSGTSRGGMLVSSLGSEQQDLVSAAIAEWVADYAAETSDPLMAAYTSDDAFADTYIAWGGSGSAPDVTVNGTYFRIDGPRVWIELSCQNGVILSGTHYHTIYRDRAFDYGAEL